MNSLVKKEKKEIIISENRDFKGVWIPERLYLTREFTPNEKFVLIEIYSLTKNKSRQCFASNKHFADFVGLKENTIQKMMLKFENAGYIKRIYEYKENSKEIDKRIIILTNKFYDSFINESENPSFDPMENNPYGNGFNSRECGGEKSTGEVDKKSEISNTPFKYNNNLSDTDLSITDKGKNINKVNAEVQTSSSEKQKKMSTSKTNLQKYLDKKAEEQDMIKRLATICYENYDDTTAKEIFMSITHYFERFKIKSGKIHPILKNNTLLRFTEKMDCFYDDRYSHFERLIGQDNAYVKMIDMFFDGDFGANKGYETNYHLSAFMSDEILNRLGQRLFELGEVH